MGNERTKESRLIVISNRLPLTLQRKDSGWSVNPAAGGLVTALSPVTRSRGGIWVGWPGVIGETGWQAALKNLPPSFGYQIEPVELTQREYDLYYHGFSNEILWPLFHDFQSRCQFEPTYWDAYREVNAKFADAVKRVARPSDYLWVQDYHLLLLGQELRERQLDNATGFFLHIPFPPPDIFLKLPWRSEILHGLLAYNLVGFQTVRDLRNFANVVRMLSPSRRVVGRQPLMSVEQPSHPLRIGAFPISIDYAEFSRGSAQPEVAAMSDDLHRQMNGRTIMLGVDRLDYTKGIPDRLAAFRLALERHPDLIGNITFVQVVVPSRDEIPEYAALKHRIESTVSEINGHFTRPGWVPIHYHYRNLRRTELLAYYRASEIALVTPLKDGMNLVAKEYVACNHEGRGVLILSEFAGAASQLQSGALLVHPYDIGGLATAIHEAFIMPAEERMRRMRKLRASVRHADIYRWADSFLRASIAKDLETFPRIEEYVPVID